MRIIARLDIKTGQLIKSIRFDGTRKVGDALKFSELYFENGIDEIFLSNITGSLFNTKLDLDLIKNIRSKVQIPLSGGGNIRNLEDAEKIIESGCDKLVINSLIHEDLDEFNKIVSLFGSSSIVGSIEYAKENVYRSYYKMARELTGYNLEDTIKKYEDIGCGEILLTEISGDGTYCGLDETIIPIIKKFQKSPILLGGGFNTFDQLKNFKEVISACVVSSALHYNKVNIKDLKKNNF